MTVWQHLSLTLEKKWIPSIKDASVTLTTYLEPKFHYLTDKSIEVLYSAKQVLTPDLIQRFDVSYYYLDQVNRIMTIAKLHLKKKVQVSFESCTKNVWHGFKKLVNLGRKKIRKVTQRAFSSG
uniref:Uncharacterized protein n=1 Tax=Brassica oleracea TaxID=3712 RepID=A0A3P6B4N9_BRAOL|nr:unnamed protein product [Brassica oleracea]